jgi:hypothetical protein
MNIYDLNPGDIIRIKPAEYRVNIFRRDITEEEFEVTHLKLNDSFPEAKIQVPMIEKQKDVNGKEFIVSERYIDYGVNAKEIQVVEHLNRNTKRWNWIVDRFAIGDNYPTLYYSIIAGNEFARFNWQTWGDDGFYHCPFCDKELNSVHEIEDRDEKAAKNVVLKSCDCEEWKARYKKYEQYLKAKNKMEKLEAELLKETRLPHKESR